MGDANNSTQSTFTWTTTNDAAVKGSRSSGSFSPAVIAVIGILGAAFLLVSYYTMVAKFCTSRGVFRGRRRRRPHGSRVGDLDRDPDVDNDEWNGVDGTVYNVVPRTQGLDEAIIKAIPVFKYNGMKVSGTYDRFADGMKVAGTYDVCADGMKVAGTCATCSGGMLEKGTCSTCGDTGAGEPKIGHSGRGLVCSVCLSEFQYEELLRMLPKCNHAFHVLCIDTWLRSHSTCPLCRANVVGNPNPYQAPPPSSPSSSSSSLSVQVTPGVITNDSASSTSPATHDGPSSPPGSSVSGGPFAASAPVVSPILPSRVIVKDIDAVIMTGNSITNSSGSSSTGHPFSSTCQNMAVRKLDTLEQVRPVEGIRNGGHGAVWKRKLNHLDQLELSEDEREQLEKQMQYWGGLIRCFSTGRAMEQTFINPPSSNVDNNAATMVMAIMRRSSSLSSYITKSASGIDRQQRNTTDESAARTKTKKNRIAEHLQHPNSNQQEALASAHHLAMSTRVPSSSSSCSTNRDFFKSRSLNHIIADGTGLKSFTKSALGLEDPLMSRMLLSLKGPRAVKRSFSGGRFFGFKMKSTTTSTDPDACSRLPI